jgi:hypothetical protein
MVMALQEMEKADYRGVCRRAELFPKFGTAFVTRIFSKNGAALSVVFNIQGQSLVLF